MLAKSRCASYGQPMSKDKKPSRQQVYTLLVEIGRKDGDGDGPESGDNGPTEVVVEAEIHKRWV